MDYKRIFEKAFGSITEKYPCSDHETAFVNVTERAEKMKDRNIQKTLTEVHVPSMPEIGKKHYALRAAAGTAAAVAVIGGSVWGLNFLNENGGLKGPDVQGAGAGYHEDMTDVSDNDQTAQDSQKEHILKCIEDARQKKNELEVEVTRLETLTQNPASDPEIDDLNNRIQYYKDLIDSYYTQLDSLESTDDSYMLGQLSGLELATAEALLNQNGIDYYIVTNDTSNSTIPADIVLSTEPPAGTFIGKSDKVTLHVSSKHFNTHEISENNPLDDGSTAVTADINIGDTIEFSDCTVNISDIERYGNTVKLTLDAYAKENCDLSTDLLNLFETAERKENRIPKGIFYERDDNDNGHLRFTFVFQPYLPEGTERTYMLIKCNYDISDSEEKAYFTLKSADTLKSYIRELDTVGTGRAGTKIPIKRIEIDPYSISFDMIGSPSFEENFSIKFKDGRIYEYNKEALVRNGRIWTDRNGDIVCAVNPDFARLGEDGDYFSEQISDHLRFFLFSEDPIFDVNEIESITILGAEIPITTE